MKENREDPAMPDRMLEQMAQETPEMPADFHNRWTRAVRAEAVKEQQADETPAAGDESIPAAGTDGRRQEGRRQWRYLLSAAAVFVVLIGGTLLTRSMDRNTRKQDDAGRNETTMMLPMQTAALTPEPEFPAANGALFDAASSERQSAAKFSVETEADFFEAEAESPEEITAEDAGAVAKEAEEAAEEPSGESEFISFLRDLGIFTLKTLGIAAAAAALAFAAALIHKALKKRKSS